MVTSKRILARQRQATSMLKSHLICYSSMMTGSLRVKESETKLRRFWTNGELRLERFGMVAILPFTFAFNLSTFLPPSAAAWTLDSNAIARVGVTGVLSSHNSLAVPGN